MAWARGLTWALVCATLFEASDSARYVEAHSVSSAALRAAQAAARFANAVEVCIVSKIGNGGFGEVFHVGLPAQGYSCLHPARFDLAVKRLVPRTATELELARTEISMLSALNGTQEFVTYFGSQARRDGREVFIFLEYASSPLSEWVEFLPIAGVPKAGDVVRVQPDRLCSTREKAWTALLTSGGAPTVPGATRGIVDGMDSDGNIRIKFDGFGRAIAVDGQDAMKCLQTSKLAGAPLEVKVGLIVQLLRAVTHLSRRRYLHRDITPSNLLVFGDCLAPEGCRLKVADFGLACGGNISVCTGNPGTRWYIPPEACCEHGVVNTDVWAAGLTAFEILIGRQPLHWEDRDFSVTHKYLPRSAKLSLIRDVYKSFPPMTDPALAAYPLLRPLLEGMLMLDANRRFIAMEALMEAQKVARLLHVGVDKTLVVRSSGSWIHHGRLSPEVMARSA